MLLVDVDTVDLFLHDSIAEILEREYELMAPKLRSGGVVIADDIYNADDFELLAQRQGLKTGHVAPNVGFAVKP